MIKNIENVETQIQFIKELLSRIDSEKDEHFSGIGIIVYRELDTNYFTPLVRVTEENNLPLTGIEQIANCLLSICINENPLHDGFHLISSDSSLTHLSYYISPQMTRKVDYSFGARYRTAQLSSCLDNVILTGVIGKSYGIKVFFNGEII